jgi:transcriptional accessory protein Tex/SPT6
MRKEAVKRLVEKHLVTDVSKEVRVELQEISENFVIKLCQNKYRDMLMTGPFDC